MNRIEGAAAAVDTYRKNPSQHSQEISERHSEKKKRKRKRDAREKQLYKYMWPDQEIPRSTGPPTVLRKPQQAMAERDALLMGMNIFGLCNSKGIPLSFLLFLLQLFLLLLGDPRLTRGSRGSSSRRSTAAAATTAATSTSLDGTIGPEAQVSMSSIKKKRKRHAVRQQHTSRSEASLPREPTGRCTRKSHPWKKQPAPPTSSPSRQ